MQGVSTQHILKTRGMTRSICMSDLLSSAAETQKFIEAGEMIADHVVGDLLLDALLLPVSAGVNTTDLNAVVDGFPRTAVQVRTCFQKQDCMRLCLCCFCLCKTACCCCSVRFWLTQ